MSAAWTAVLLGSAGCYLLKLAGWQVPPALLARERVRRTARLLPVALLAALVVVQAFGARDGLVLDARAAGLAVAGVLVLLRAPFLVVVLAAAATAALLRA
ncbi:MAG: AzlD domain-containing protein [Actinomycetota bacterium]|nr:AzlD domain-containing protein [Actinomycetota bacterium]